jgi:heme/copper-type cytochrome/quinol oxidase subunit 4
MFCWKSEYKEIESIDSTPYWQYIMPYCLSICSMIIAFVSVYFLIYTHNTIFFGIVILAIFSFGFGSVWIQHGLRKKRLPIGTDAIV